MTPAKKRDPRSETTSGDRLATRSEALQSAPLRVAVKWDLWGAFRVAGLSSLTRLAVVVWVAIVATVGVRVLLMPRTNSVYPIFSNAGRNWLAGAELYGPPRPDLDQYRYSPLVAAGFAPWGLLPDRVGGALWRAFNAAAFLAALGLWCRIAWRRPPVAWAFLLVVPLGVGSLNNGQINPLVTATLLTAAACVAAERWSAAAGLTALAALCKGYPLAFGLLLCLVAPRRLAPRLALALTAGLALPFAFHPTDYVLTQYRAWVERVRLDDRTAWPLHAGYQDFHMLLRLLGWQLSLSSYRAVQVLAGLAAAALVWHRLRRGATRAEAAATCFDLGCCWMTLFGPATETCTYILLAPTLARAVREAPGRPGWERASVYGSLGLFVLSVVALWFPAPVWQPIHALGVQPLGALLLTAAIAGQAVRAARAGESSGSAAPAHRAA